jgi:translation initiation factor IF-2
MGKKRVYELAREIGMENKALIARLKQMGIEVASHSSTIDDVDASNLILAIEKEKKGTQVEKRVTPGVIRRRPKVEAAPAEPEISAPSAEQLAALDRAVEAAGAAPAGEAVAEPPPAEPRDEAAQEVAPAAPPAKPETGKEEPLKPKRVHKLGIEIVGPPIPLSQLESRGGFRPPPAEDRTKVQPAAPVPVQRKTVEDIRTEKEKEKGPKKRTTGRRMKELDRREIFDEAERAGFPAIRSKKRLAKKTTGKTEITTPKAIKRIVRMDGQIQVGDLARTMGIKAGEVIKKLMGLGIMATLNQTIDSDTATLIAHDFEWEVQRASEDLEQKLEAPPDKPESLKSRSPVVTVMGHVDHGKTTLLDAIRSTDKAGEEAGGITQHIGAYRVTVPRGAITFLDTPGHEAFTEMRARGAKLTDIVVLVVAADDGIQPQTVEAINHAKEAGVPIIVAINKMDRPNAQPDRIKQALTEHGLVVEEWGGETLVTPISAKKKEGIKELLDQILLEAEMLDLRANPEKLARGVVVEARLDKGRGPVATVLVQEGTLKPGDPIVAGQHCGKVRAMYDENGNAVAAAGPSTPVEVIGLTGVPLAGDVFNAAESERIARDVAGERAGDARQASLAKDSKLTLESLFGSIKDGEAKTFKIVLKVDVQGSLAPIADTIQKLGTEKVKMKVIHSGVGGIIESDVNLANASEAVIIGFNVRPETGVQETAAKVGVDIRTYNVIFDLIDDVKKAASGLLAPRIQENYLGRAEVKQIFNLPKVGVVAGCSVVDGKIARSARVRLLRDSVVVYQGKLGSLKRFKEDVREVQSGLECGLSIENYSDVKPGDLVEAFEVEEIAVTL